MNYWGAWRGEKPAIRDEKEGRVEAVYTSARSEEGRSCG